MYRIEARIALTKVDKAEMTPTEKDQQSSSIPALQVHQWQPEWDQIDFDKPHRAGLDDHFFFSIKASVLWALCAIEWRNAHSSVRWRGR